MYFLNPNYQYLSTVKNDKEVAFGFWHVVDRMVPDPAPML